MKRLKIPFLYLLSFVLSIGPVVLYFMLNIENYIQTVSDGIKLALGATILMVIVLLKVLGKLKLPSRIYLFGITFLLCYLLASILKDLIIFSLLALIGEILDCICQALIKKAKEDRAIEKAAEKNAQEMAKAFSGRV
ncbi:MAG: hypothetical protein E7596_00305 [Ruminococcaceae bacterium]|nr:hypothetical protein [Oscillospiraceae bacterium]